MGCRVTPHPSFREVSGCGNFSVKFGKVGHSGHLTASCSCWLKGQDQITDGASQACGGPGCLGTWVRRILGPSPGPATSRGSVEALVCTPRGHWRLDHG